LIRVLFATEHVSAISTELNANNLKHLNDVEGICIDFYNTNYEEYDVVLFMGYDFDIERARFVNPNIKIGIIDPRPGLKKQPVGVDFILANGIEMKDWYLQYTPNIFTYYIYPQVRQKVKRHLSSDTIRIGYHGNRWHLHEMYPRITQALEKLGNQYEVELWAMYNIEKHGQWDWGLPDKDKVHIKHIQWSEAHYEEHLSKVDIGIIPNIIPANEEMMAVWVPDPQPKSMPEKKGKWMGIKNRIEKIFQRSAAEIPAPQQTQNHPGQHVPITPYQEQDTDYLVRYKATSNPGRIFVFAQYGIPVIADMFPSALQIIEDEVDGFVCYSTAAWYQALKRLADDSELRTTVAQNMLKKFDKIAAPDVLSERLAKFLREL
jgi:hypothetical protein